MAAPLVMHLTIDLPWPMPRYCQPLMAEARQTTRDARAVTCKHCLAKMRRVALYQAAQPPPQGQEGQHV